MILKIILIAFIIFEQVGLLGWETSLINKLFNNERSKNQSVFFLQPRSGAENVKKQNFNLDFSPLPKKISEGSIDVAAAGASAFDVGTSAVLFEKNSKTKVPMASLTKIMTAIVTLDKNNLDDTVAVTKNALKVDVQESQMGLVEGEQIKVRELLYGLLMNSGNDAALALAEHEGGTTEKFVDLMNKKASDLGLTNTQFKNPTGMDEDGHYSCPYDIGKLLTVALRYPLFYQIVGTTETFAYSTDGRQHYLKDTNELLGVDPRILGGKTGSTDKAGRCFATLAKEGDNQIITVVFDSPDRFGQTKMLINWIYQNYSW